MLKKLVALQVNVRVEDMPALLRGAKQAGWSAVDSGKRVRSEDGIAREAVVVLRIPLHGRGASQAEPA